MCALHVPSHFVYYQAVTELSISHRVPNWRWLLLRFSMCHVTIVCAATVYNVALIIQILKEKKKVNYENV
jgi:hypothetical protein